MCICEILVEKTKKRNIIIGIVCSVAILLAVGIGLTCFFLCQKEKPVAVTIQNKTAILFEDETEAIVSQLFGLSVSTKEDYWVLYDGYDHNIINVAMNGSISIKASGTTTIVAKVCTKANTLSYMLTLHVVSRGYATDMTFEQEKIYFNYLDSVQNALIITTPTNTNYNYPVEVTISDDRVVYDVTTGTLSYIGNKQSTTDTLEVLVGCKVRKSATEYIEATFTAYVDFTRYASMMTIDSSKVSDYTYTLHTTDEVVLDVKVTNQYEKEENVEVPVEYTVLSRPEGTTGNELSVRDNQTLFHAGNKVGTYQILAKVQSGIDKLGHATYLSEIFTIDVVEALTNDDFIVSVVDEQGKEVGTQLLYVGVTYSINLTCTKHDLVATNLQSVAVPSHMYISYDKTIKGKVLSFSFLCDKVGRYTFGFTYVDKCSMNNHILLDFALDVTVMNHEETTITFTKGDCIIPVSERITLSLFDKAYASEANGEGVYDRVTVALHKGDLPIAIFNVVVDNTNIVYYDSVTGELIAVSAGKTTIKIADPTTTQVWTYEVVVDKVTGSIPTLGNITLYLHEDGEENNTYPTIFSITFEILPNYALKDWEYDEHIIHLVYVDGTLILRAKAVGFTTLMLGGTKYATIDVVEYVNQEEFDIQLLRSGEPITSIIGKGAEQLTVLVTKNGVKVEADISIRTTGVYAFLSHNEIFVRYEEKGILTILAKVGGVTISKDFIVEVKEG